MIRSSMKMTTTTTGQRFYSYTVRYIVKSRHSSALVSINLSRLTYGPPLCHVTIEALGTSLVWNEHGRHQKDYTDCVVGTMRDGYLQLQIPDDIQKVRLLLGDSKVQICLFAHLSNFFSQYYALGVEQSITYGTPRPVFDASSQRRCQG